jgi:hypothetical protein
MRTLRRFDLRRGRGWRALVAFGALLAAIGSLPVAAQSTGRPSASVQAAPSLSFPNAADSNSPAVWDLIGGEWTLTVLTSVEGSTWLSRGGDLDSLESVGPVSFTTAAPPGGYWFESVIPDSGVWYGFYHNEVTGVCPESEKVVARIGAARSTDYGLTWEDLGAILETPLEEVFCETRNEYFAGGVGDFSAVLDADSSYLYFYYSQYAEPSAAVGVSVARMAWAERDAPSGQIDIWTDGAWLPTLGSDESEDRGPFLASPILRARDSWDNPSPAVDVLWGPAIHWNTHIKTYVMLLNRASSAAWEQGGIYVSYNDDVSNPNGWTAPVLLLRGGAWYPQVVGLGSLATDTYAGSPSRFFMQGNSAYTIVFERR